MMIRKYKWNGLKNVRFPDLSKVAMKERAVGLSVLTSLVAFVVLFFLGSSTEMQGSNPLSRTKNGFAIVVDANTYEATKQEIANFARAIEEVDNLKTYIINENVAHPDSIRNTLKNLYYQKKQPIEGAVFIGDIPIPMIRDAQHMTSAFKMDQEKWDRRESSVPSDRFYDDFDLRFKFLDQDDKYPYFYYSLTSASCQYLHPEIYTGRIRPTGVNKYEKLRSYLTKATSWKRHMHELKRVFFFGGHGYISESMEARMDEKIELYEHFPWLLSQSGGIGFMDHSQEGIIKFRLMNELIREDLDLAILHHHGSDDTQYLSEIPRPKTCEDAKKYIVDYCKSKLRSWSDGRMTEKEAIENLSRRFDIPARWFDNALDPQVSEADSIEHAKLDLHLADFAQYDYKPNTRAVIIDACYCGAFNNDDCIADEYIFSGGKTIVCIANTVNVLQDKWSNKNLGLLGLGVPIGEIVRNSHYLESHIIGDPTFSFSPAYKWIKRINCDSKRSLEKLIRNGQSPELQSYIIERLYYAGKISSSELLKIFKSSQFSIVRLQCLYCISAFNDENMLELFSLGMFDSNEMVQRQAVKLTGDSGNVRLIPSLIALSISNNISERTNFNLSNVLSLFPKDLLLKEFYSQFNSKDVKYINKAQVEKEIENAIVKNSEKWTKYIDIIVASSDSTDSNNKTTLKSPPSRKKKLLYIRFLRNYCPHSRIPELLDYLVSIDDSQQQVALLEALGWRTKSYQKTLIILKAEEIANNPKFAESVRKEAAKTVKRLSNLDI